MQSSDGWFDSHCHLQDEYRQDGRSVLESLREAQDQGVCGVICVGTDAENSRQAVEMVATLRGSLELDFMDLWATVGLHPHDAERGVESILPVLDEALSGEEKVVVGIGECGLDYHYLHAPREAQRKAFAAQIALAKEHDLTLVVHTREAWDETFDILRSEGPPSRTVLHCFTGGPDEARRCLDLGAYLSFSGIVTFKTADELRAAVALCPVDRLLVETDAPFLAPVPHRGKLNRPAWVATVGEAVAALRGVSALALAQATTHATQLAFALPGSVGAEGDAPGLLPPGERL